VTTCAFIFLRRFLFIDYEHRMLQLGATKNKLKNDKRLCNVYHKYVQSFTNIIRVYQQSPPCLINSYNIRICNKCIYFIAYSKASIVRVISVRDKS
jgi:hypothetical protein